MSRRLITLGTCLAAVLSGGCLPHYRAPAGLARERDRIRSERALQRSHIATGA